MRLVLTVDPQGYLYGLGEVPSSWPMSALKTQAIAARTYAFTKAAASQHRAVCDCALYASSYDQVYAGWDKEGGVDGDRWVAAVNQTEDQVVLNGAETIQAFYMSSSGGYTENNENVWGGTPIDYLRGVCDPGDYTSENPNAVWEQTFTPAQVTQHLGLGIGTVTGFTNVDRGVSGRIMSVTVIGANGQAAISGDALRSRSVSRTTGCGSTRTAASPARSGPSTTASVARPGSPPRARSRSRAASGRSSRMGRSTTRVRPAPISCEVWSWAAICPRAARRVTSGSRPPTSASSQNGNLRASFEGGVITCDPDGSSCTRHLALPPLLSGTAGRAARAAPPARPSVPRYASMNEVAIVTAWSAVIVAGHIHRVFQARSANAWSSGSAG